MTNFSTKIAELTAIPHRIWEGYIWGSDMPNPKVLREETYDFTKEWKNQKTYIVEALLYCRAEDISLTIKYVGHYLIQEIDVKKLREDKDIEFYPIDYIPHRLTENNTGNTITALSFEQVWIAEEDPLCEGMPVLQQKAFVFTGFKS